MLTIGSLFSGIGGLELGLERAGLGPVKWQVEQDDYAQAVLTKHWPAVPRFRDVREVGEDTLAPVDLVCGGFPCQDVSLAGKGAGLAGEHSGLWREFARIVRELRPRFVVVENVSALLARGLGTVLGDLAACGYGAEWDCIPARAVGAHHQRDRLFVVAYAHRERLAERAECDGTAETRRAAVLAGGDAHGFRDAVADTHEPRLAQRSIFGRDACEELTAAFRASREGAGIWATEPDVGRVATGVPARVDRLRCLGNAVVPQVAEFIGRRILTCAT